MSTKKSRSPKFKLKIALAAIKGKQTISEICILHKVAESLVHKWRKQLLEQGEAAFPSSTPKASKKLQEKEIAKLYEKIGQLTIERDFLKKNLDV